MPKPPKTRCQPWLDGGEPETKAVLYINLARLLNYANNPVKDDWASDSSESRAGHKISMLVEWSLENQFDSGSAWHLHAIISIALHTILSIVISHSWITIFQLYISLQIGHGIRPTRCLNTWIKQPRRRLWRIIFKTHDLTLKQGKLMAWNLWAKPAIILHQ